MNECLSIRHFTCLWVEDLRREVRWWRAGGEVFIAVGDEWCQRVDVVGMLHHWDFIGLLMQKGKKKKQEKNRQREFMSRRRPLSSKHLSHSIQNTYSVTHQSYYACRGISLSLFQTVHCTWLLLVIVWKTCIEVNRPSSVNALHGKHHSLCVWPALWCNLDQHQGTLKSLADTCQDHYSHLVEERTVCSVQQEKQQCHQVQKSRQKPTNKHNQAKVNYVPINNWRHHLPLSLTAASWWEYGKQTHIVLHMTLTLQKHRIT